VNKNSKIMPGRKISEFPQKEFSSDMMDNSFFVDNINTPHISAIPLKNVFDEIIKRAKEQGLKVELQSDRIVFITSKTVKGINDLKIFELAFDGEKTWIAARTIIEAIQTYCSVTGMDLVEFEGDEEITELPREKWTEHIIREDDQTPEQTFEDWMKENHNPDIIAGTMY